jgi:hypothetical protein
MGKRSPVTEKLPIQIRVVLVKDGQVLAEGESTWKDPMELMKALMEAYNKAKDKIEVV